MFKYSKCYAHNEIPAITISVARISSWAVSFTFVQNSCTVGTTKCDCTLVKLDTDGIAKFKNLHINAIF